MIGRLLFLVILFYGNLCQSQTPNYVPTNGLVGWWPFDGNANDLSINNNNGLVNNALLTSDRLGNVNSAYSFSPFSASFISIPFSSSLNSIQTGITMSAWVLMDGGAPSSTPPRILELRGAYGGGGDAGFVMLATDNNNSNRTLELKWYNNFGNTNLNFSPTSSSLPALTWHHVVFTADGITGIAKYYFDGVLQSNFVGNPITQCNYNNNLLYFGSESSFLGFWGGKLDDIGIWNRALSQNEITNLYNSINTPAPSLSVSPASTVICSGVPVTLTASTSGSTVCSAAELSTNLQAGLVGYWPFCGNANDASGNGNNGTVNGATLTTDRFGNTNSAYLTDSGPQIIQTSFPGISGINSRTISVWFNQSASNNSNDQWTLFNYGNSAFGGGFGAFIFPGNHLGIDINNSYVTYNPAILLNQWNHLVVSYSSNLGNTVNSIKIYLNGALLDIISSQYNTGLQLNSGIASPNFTIGGNPFFLPQQFLGKLDDIAIWNRDLNTSEIQQLYIISNASYIWSPSGATTQFITVSPTATTTYTVTASANGQSSTSSSVVTVNTPPTITASTSSICVGQSTTLTAASQTPSPSCPSMTGTLSSGLVGFWPFCGNANDASGNGNHGIVNGPSLTTDRFGNVNSAYYFNNNSINVLHNSNFGFDQNQGFTVSFWALKQSPNNGHIMGKRPLNGQGFNWQVADWGGLQFCGTSGSNIFGYISNQSLTLSNWEHIISIYNNGIWEIYINGLLAMGSSQPGFFQDVICDLTFGVSGAYAGYIGKLDDIGIWNRALTTAEIQLLYTQGQTTYSWSPGGATTPSITVSPTSTTTYTCTVTANGTTCSSSQTIMVNPLPVASITPAGPVNLCQGQSVTLCAPNTPGLTYLWCNASTTSCITTNFAGNYCLVVTDANGCTSNSVSTIVNVAPLPTANAGTDFTKTCVTNPSGTLVGMTPVAGNTYTWTPATGLSSASSANPTANPAATTTYTLTATNTASGCTATDQVLVTVNTALPTVNAGLDQTICQGVSTVLNANSNGTSLSWNNGVQNNISFVPSTVGTTTYTATATGSNGCTANDNVVVTVNPLPSAAVTTNGTSSFCPGSSVQLCAPTGTGYSYLWSGNLGTTQCVTISSSATTSVTVTNAFNCSATSAPQQVTVFTNPVASAGLDATITCVQNASGAQIGDVPNPTYTYSWTPATGLSSATIGNPIANPSTTTTYTLTVVNADGCMGSDQVTVTVNNTPPTANAGLDQSICLGASLVLQGSTNGASGTWNNGVTNGISFTPSQTGTTSYTYSTVGANGCVNNDQVSVTVNALPVANSGQGAVITCVQNVNGVQLGANPISGNTYAWTPTSGLNNTNIANPTATPTASTTYTLLMSDANGCSDTAQVVVTVNNNPPIVSAGNDANVCSGDSLYLFANTTVGSTVVWNGTIQNGSNILPAQSGYQVAMATAANGCTAQDSLLVNLLQPTTSTLNEVACDEFVLNGNVYLQTGTYTQLLTNAAGCDSTITLNLTINLSPATPVVYVQNEVNLSTDVVPGQTYQWIYCSDLIPVPGATNPTFNPAANAIYAVVVTNNCGSDTSSCTTVSTIGLADHQQPEIAIYPNPNNGHFTILLPENNGSAKLEVLDLNGRIIFESILDEQANELHLESLSSGTYWLRINQQVPVPVTKY